MSWLTPLGFLGLIGLIVLILIYIIKPNYQQKFISSTYVWRMSLKYRKKQLPINRLRNILLFLCQVLAITACAVSLAQPYIAGEKQTGDNRKIVILDASAGMRTETAGVTRFERAVSEVKKLSGEILKDDGELTVILAGAKASYVVQRAGADAADDTVRMLDGLISANDFACTWGSADIDGALELAETVLLDCPEAEVVLYTDTTYTDAGKVRVVDVSDVSEWNAAVLDLRVSFEENYYRFEVDVACYNRDKIIDVYLDVSGVNVALEQYQLAGSAECTANETCTVVFDVESGLLGDLGGIYSYTDAHAYIKESDNFTEDNSFYRYGGTKQPLKVQYYSTLSNNFYGGVLMGLREASKGYWDFDIDTIQDSAENVAMGYQKEYKIEGYDIYIFEHYMPSALPTDGLVILAAPDTVPAGAGFTMSKSWYGSISGEVSLIREATHPLLQGLNVENITVTLWADITSYDDGFVPLVSCGGAPVILARNTASEKTLIMGLDLNYSNLALTAEFPLFFLNALNWYFPQTISSNVYEVNDTLKLNARAEELELSGPDLREKLNEFPHALTLTTPGSYGLYQVPISGKDVNESFFVRIPVAESNTEAVFDSLGELYDPPQAEIEDRDLVFYVALILVLLLFAEWWLQTREQF